MENKIFEIWIYLAFGGLLAFFAYNIVERRKHTDALHSVGFKLNTLVQLSNQELKDFYDYIFEYTQKGIMPRIGSALDFRLLDLAKKFPDLLNYK